VADLPELFTAFNARDWDRFDAVVDELFAPGFLLHLPKRGSDALDRDAYAAAVRREVETHPDLHYAIGETMTGPDRLAVTLERRFALGGRATMQTGMAVSLPSRAKRRSRVSPSRSGPVRVSPMA